ncbi:MAG: cell envelope integrity protein CreD [Pseudomonadota bacterium]
MSDERSPGMKLVLVGVIGAMLVVPLAMVYWLVGDRQHQARVAQNSVTQAWAGPQAVAGPTLMVPYISRSQTTETVDGKPVRRTFEVRKRLFIAPSKQTLDAVLNPEVRTRGTIHRTVVYDAVINGEARFDMPGDLARLDIDPESLLLDEAILQLPISDPRGLQTDARLIVDRKRLDLRPGLANPDQGAGVHAFLDWSDGGEVIVDFKYSVRGSNAFGFVPRGEETDLAVRSSWLHPSFAGGFLPNEADRKVDEEGFSASWSISNLALGQSLVSKNPLVLPAISPQGDGYSRAPMPQAQSMATIRLIEPVDLYKQVERSLKYGFLFIGFTFTAFLMFDIVGGARVASAEYMLTGAGLILFIVMLLAFAEMIGFGFSYVIASSAIIGLLTSYSAAVLGGWLRAGFIAALLSGLYAVLYVLLNLEAWSLVIGSLMLFFALATVMYTTRGIEWAKVNLSSGESAPT